MSADCVRSSRVSKGARAGALTDGRASDRFCAMCGLLARDLKLQTSDLRLLAQIGIHHEVERLGEERFHFASVDDGVDHAVTNEKFRSLKILRQLLSNRLFDHARARESNQGLWFGDD